MPYLRELPFPAWYPPVRSSSYIFCSKVWMNVTFPFALQSSPCPWLGLSPPLECPSQNKGEMVREEDQGCAWGQGQVPLVFTVKNPNKQKNKAKEQTFHFLYRHTCPKTPQKSYLQTWVWPLSGLVPVCCWKISWVTLKFVRVYLSKMDWKATVPNWKWFGALYREERQGRLL